MNTQLAKSTPTTLLIVDYELVVYHVRGLVAPDDAHNSIPCTNECRPFRQLVSDVRQAGTVHMYFSGTALGPLRAREKVFYFLFVSIRVFCTVI